MAYLYKVLDLDAARPRIILEENFRPAISERALRRASFVKRQSSQARLLISVYVAVLEGELCQIAFAKLLTR